MSIHVNNSLSTLKKLIILILITMLLTSACSRSAPGVTIRQAPSSTISQNENQNLTTTDETTSPAVQAQNDDGIVLPFAPSNPISGGLLVAEYLAGGLANRIRSSIILANSDLKTAKTFVIPLGGKNSQEVVEKLKEFSFIIRKVLSKRIAMKFLPKLLFVKDESFDYAEKIESLIKQTHK